MTHRILIVGCGSIGERHLRCFQRTGRAELAVCDVNESLLATVCQRYQVPGFRDASAALAAGPYQGVVICSPAHTHIGIAVQSLGHGAGVLIEKPLSTRIDDVDAPAICGGRGRQVCGRRLRVPLRPGRRGDAGVPARRVAGPASAGLGGRGAAFSHLSPGVPRDLLHSARNGRRGHSRRADAHGQRGRMAGRSHDAAVLRSGPPGARRRDGGRHRLRGGPQRRRAGQLHAEPVPGAERNHDPGPLRTGGSVRYEGHEQRWSVFRRGESSWTHHAAPVAERDDLFVAQAHAFLDGLEGKPTPLCTIEEAVQTLKFNLAALESARTGKAISIS